MARQPAKPQIKPNDDVKTTLRIIPNLAKEIGMNESIILMQISYWIGISTNYIDSKWWIYKSTYEMVSEAFTWLSAATVNRAINVLIKKKLLYVSDKYNKKPYDKTRWFALNVEQINRLASVTIPVPKTLMQNEAGLMQSDAGIEQNSISLMQNEARSNQFEARSTQNEAPIPETTTEITTLKTKDSSSDESSTSDSPIDESGPEIKTETAPIQAKESGTSKKANPATKAKNSSALQANDPETSQTAKSDESDLSPRGDSPPPYAYDFDNNPLSRADFDARLTSFKTMTTAVYFIYDHPKAKTKLVPSQVAKIAHQLLGSDKTKEGKKITGLRKKFAFTEQPATPQEVIAFGIWHKRDGGWIPSQKAEELHEQFTEYRNVAYHERFMELADSQLRNLLRIRIGAPFPKHEIAPADPLIDVDKLLTEMAGEISAQQQATSDENQKNKIKWSQETARHYQLYRASAVPGTIRRSYYVD